MVLGQAAQDGGLGGWIIGLAIGAVVVVIVAVLLALIIATARRIEKQAATAIETLETAYRHTKPLWHVRTANDTLEAITGQARTLRHQVLEGGD